MNHQPVLGKAKYKKIQSIIMAQSKQIAKAILGILAFAAVSCHNEGTQTVEVSEFPDEETLDTLHSVTPAYSEHLTNSINMAGDYIMAAVYKSPYLFSVYNRNYELVDTIVPKGHGSDEMMSAIYSGQWEGEVGNPSVRVFEPGANKFLKLNIAPYSGAELVGALPTNENLSPSRVLQTQDSTLIGVNLAPGGQSTLFRYNIPDKSLTFATDNLTFNPEAAFYTSQCGLAVSEDGENIATSYISIPLICLYDKDFKLLKKIFIGPEIDTSTVKTDDHYNGFINIEYVGDKIAALYMNVTEKNANKLLVFDKDGTPLASYGIGNSIGICIDSHSGRMISLVYDDDAGLMKFYIYPIPKLLSQSN